MNFSPFEQFVIHFIVHVIGLVLIGTAGLWIGKALLHLIAFVALKFQDRTTARINRHAFREFEE